MERAEVIEGPCALCSRRADETLSLGPSQVVCLSCTARLGQRLLEQPLSLASVWPQLDEQDDEDPEPRIRREDGTSIELRERTAELKQDLDVADRMRLAETLAELGLGREHLLECGFVLSRQPRPELAQRALNLLFVTVVPSEAVERLRSALFPC